MTRNAAFYVAIFATTALFIGYHYARYKIFAGELVARLKQVPILRDARDHHFGAMVLLSVLTAAVIYVIAKH
jgi:hypothetical protein